MERVLLQLSSCLRLSLGSSLQLKVQLRPWGEVRRLKVRRRDLLDPASTALSYTRLLAALGALVPGLAETEATVTLSWTDGEGDQVRVSILLNCTVLYCIVMHCT